MEKLTGWPAFEAERNAFAALISTLNPNPCPCPALLPLWHAYNEAYWYCRNAGLGRSAMNGHLNRKVHFAHNPAHQNTHTHG
jgi:hypothetical protein